MEPYQQRVVDEKNALDENLAKLIKFIESTSFTSDVAPDEKGRLIRQRGIMSEYSQILEQRIGAF